MNEKSNGLKWLAGIMTILAIVCFSYAILKPDTVTEVIPEGYVSSEALDEIVSNAVNTAIAEKDAEIANLTSKETGVSSESEGYLIDELAFESPIIKLLSDREVKTLFDGKVYVDDESYDAEEVLSIDGLVVKANEKDFEGIGYLVFPKESIEYSVVFENKLNTSKIDNDDNSLKFNFLGKEIEITNWDEDSVTFFEGEEYILNEGEEVVVNEKTVRLEVVSDNDNVFVSVDGESKKINEGQTKTINGLEIRVEMVVFNSVTPRLMAVMVIGEDVEKVIYDGDEYEEDSIWSYKISQNSVGIFLDEEFTELDDELKPLAVGEILCLPNEYVCVRYDGTLEEKTEEISFELDTRDGIDYVEIKGNFQAGLNDYSKIYINRATGLFYDKKIEAITEEITIGNSNVVLEVSAGNIIIEDLTINLDLNSSNVVDDESDYRTIFGILIKNPEDSLDNQEWRIEVPYEQLENKITVL